MDLIRFDRTDHHPVTFAFVADRNFPDSDFHRAVCNDRQTSTSVFGRNAQTPAIRGRLGERAKSTQCGSSQGAKNHMWTAPACKGFEDRFGDLVGCSHMSGPFVRRIWPLALMRFGEWVPIKTAR
jgi:hypothetical protein